MRSLKNPSILIQSVKGVYLLFARLERRKEIEVGALGDIEFEPGIYVYIGSAMNGAENRISRHFSSDKNKHWHIDYLVEEAEVFDYFVIPEDSSYECKLAGILASLATPVEKFGCSDCDCRSHLFCFQKVFGAMAPINDRMVYFQCPDCGYKQRSKAEKRVTCHRCGRGYKKSDAKKSKNKAGDIDEEKGAGFFKYSS